MHENEKHKIRMVSCSGMENTLVLGWEGYTESYLLF